MPEQIPLIYPEKKLSQAEDQAQRFQLNLENIPLTVSVPDIDQLPNEQYALLRKDGLGTSDSSVVLGVNPFKTIDELIAEKCRTALTEEEKAVQFETAVRKGLDLESLIIKKFQEAAGIETGKPSDMYAHKDYPYLKFNFDGVTDTPKQYIPVEIKTVTAKGERHYTPAKAYYQEGLGFKQIPPNFSESNNSIQIKAAQYGIPPYYYTQLQQQILGLNAPYGYLSVLLEVSWKLHVFFVWRDDKMIKDLILNGFKTWQKIEAKRGVDFDLNAATNINVTGETTGKLS